MKVLGISGSWRTDSLNSRLLRAAADELPPAAELFEWTGLPDIPAFSQEIQDDPQPGAVRSLKRAIEEADAILIVTPEYNGSIPGALKNALDWVSRPYKENPLRGKPALAIGASTGMGGTLFAQADMRRVLGRIGASVLDEELPLPQARDAFGDDGELLDDDYRDALAGLLEQLTDAAAGNGATAREREPAAA